MKLTFLGAARQVTGSMYLLELEDDYKILIDCGMDMDRNRDPKKEQMSLPYSVFPFEPTQINVVLLTHAHIDHSGNLPNLIREGYEGQILCTAPTLPLADLLLQDMASLNAKRLKAFQAELSTGTGRRKKKSKKGSKVDPNNLYLDRQVNETIDRVVTVAFHHKFRLKKGVELTFIPTGHLLGAANIVLEITENGKKTTIGFSGDIGRKDYPLLPDPERMPEVDYLVCESTYGSRYHTTPGTQAEALAEIIKSTCIDNPGRLIIPAFSVGRTQALLYTINKLYTQGGFPPVKVFSDSPLALKSTRVYEKFLSYLNADAKEFHEDHDSLFDFENLVFVQDLKQSKALANHAEPCIIISSSGMISGGRVEHHVMTNLPNPYATILMIGFAAEGTLGAKLLKGMRSLSIAKDQEIPIMARIESIDVFSGHGDLGDLTEFVKYQSPDRLKKVFLVHGEYESMVHFQGHLAGEGYSQVVIPEYGQSFEL
jgi:metallo-beta-lactamase family protein